MKKFALTAIAVAVAQTAAAGGIDRSGQSVSVIHEDGNYGEFSLGYVDGKVSGVAAGQASGDVAPAYTQISGAYKWGYGGPIDVAVIFDQPWGATVDYAAGTTYPLAGSNATLTSQAITVVGKYDLGGGFSLHGGARAQTLEMDVSLPVVASYTGQGDRTVGYGYLVGASYEKPEIALRVSLTYNSAVDHDIPTTETGPVPGTSTTRVTTPQSVNLDFQTGIAADTLLFGSARWVEWGGFDISPIGYATVPSTGPSLVAFADDKITYSLGLGRKFNDNWSGAVTLGYEAASGGTSSNLAPTDGRRSVGVGATYTMGDMEITGGVSYVLIGDTTTVVSSTGPVIGTFQDNSAIAAGIKFGFKL